MRTKYINTIDTTDISFQFLFNFSIFLSEAHQLFLKNFQPHIISYTYNCVELFLTSVFGLWWIGMSVGVLGDNAENM